MSFTTYEYSALTDTLNGIVALNELAQEISASTIKTALERIDVEEDLIRIVFRAALDSTDEQVLYTLVANHTGERIPPVDAEIDSDGRQVVRQAITFKGWIYMALAAEVHLCSTDADYCKDEQGNDIAFVQKVLFDSEGNATNDPAFAVKTIFDIELPFDIEMVAGRIKQKQKAGSDIRLWAILAPYIPTEQGGSVHFTNGGLNLAYEDEFSTDGRSPKKLKYNATYRTNMIRIVAKHPPASAHSILLILDLYRKAGA